MLALIPWILGMGYFLSRSLPRMNLLNREIEGTKHLVPYIRILDLLQRHRGLSFLYLNLPPDTKNENLTRSLMEIEETFLLSCNRLQKILLRDHGQDSKELKKICQDFRKLTLNRFRGDPEENFWRHTHLIERVLSLMESEGYQHDLFSDPDLYVRTLAQVALIEIPKITEILGRIRGLGSGYIARGRITPAERKTMLRLYAVAHAYSGALEWTVKNVRFPEKTMILMRSASREMEDFLKRSEDLITTGFSPSLTPLGYFKIASGVIETLIELYVGLSQELAYRLRLKKRELLKDWILSSVLFSAIFIFLCFSFYFSYRSVVHKLSVITEGAKRIAQGDLSTRIELDSRDEIGELAAVLNQSVEKLRKNIEEIYFLHYYDRLTRLPNRDKLFEDLNQAEAPALLLLDIHNFKDLNFVCGEECGDYILKTLASRLKQQFHPHPVYRVGPDEFAILVDLARHGLSQNEFFGWMEREMKELEKKPFRWKGEDIYPAFFGAAVCDCVYPEKLLIFAYDALKEAKEEQKKLVRVSSPAEKRRPLYEERMLWIRKTKEALREDRIRPFYQPILNLHSQKIEKFEALVRLIDEDGTVVSPHKFLELSQKMGLYPEITRKVIDKALLDFEKLPFEVSINLSFMDFESQEIKSYLKDKLEEIQDQKILVEPHRLIFEVVESQHIKNYDVVENFIKELKQKGCKIAIDDFGSGYSNLERLIGLRVDYLKIDASLIRRIPEDQTARLLVEAILQFARRVGILTIAEFVADERIYRAVKDLGIDYAQGYFIGPPDPIEVIREKYL